LLPQPVAKWLLAVMGSAVSLSAVSLSAVSLSVVSLSVVSLSVVLYQLASELLQPWPVLDCFQQGVCLFLDHVLRQDLRLPVFRILVLHLRQG
jgi:hypothetical protein